VIESDSEGGNWTTARQLGPVFMELKLVRPRAPENDFWPTRVT
jgi:hypothetical protein